MSATEYGWERWRRAFQPKKWTLRHATADGWVTACGMGIPQDTREQVEWDEDDSCSTCGIYIETGWPDR